MKKHRHHRKSRFKSNHLSEDTPSLLRLWLLRLLVPLGGCRKLLRERHSSDDLLNSLAQIFDIDMEDYETEDDDIDRKELIRHIEKLYLSVKTDKPLRPDRAIECLARNVGRLSALASLSATDCRILEFAVLIHTEETLEETGSLLGDLTSKQVFRILSILLDLPQTEVRKSLGKDGALCKSGLLSLDQNVRHELKHKLDLLSSGFAENMVALDEDPVALLRDAVSPGSPPHLAIDDFPHLARELGALLPYLRKALTSKRKGVNILLHGDPGTGKSQLAKVLAAETGCQLFEVASEGEDREPLAGYARLRSFRAAQTLLSGRKIIILFDEIEDVFNADVGGIFVKIFGLDETAHNPKAWLNQRLEENQTPTLWIANSISAMHPAFKRRFDMVIKMPVPPRRQRQKVIRASCSDLLSERDIERLSSAERLVPAVVTRASAVVETIGDELAQTDRAATLELIINNTLEAQGHQRIKRHDPNQLPETYNPEFIHADTDVESIVAGLKKAKAGRLCLYGPPGTGKTAYGRWLAEQLDVPLLVKRGSDLISMWVGETEKNIAECFRQAETEGAILLIDEIEGFLQDRREARRSWEVTGVNEMLTQTESFSGIFIASTNLVDNLDQASLRRFDLKIKFDFLLPQQSQALLESYCHTLNLDAPDNGLASRLGRLHNLTPGDFAAVMRRRRFMPVCSAAEIMAALEEECSLKENFKRPIGFC